MKGVAEEVSKEVMEAMSLKFGMSIIQNLCNEVGEAILGDIKPDSDVNDF